MPGLGKIILLSVVGLVLLVLFVPAIRQAFTRLTISSETVVVPEADPGVGRELEIFTLLGYDAIPAILSPEFVDSQAAAVWMDPDEQVLGLSINGDHRAYPITMLSRHEIVNDVVGGRPVAVTW